MADTAKSASRRSRWYAFARALAAAALSTVFPVRFHHRDRLQAVEAPFILIGNHQSWMDPIPMALCVKNHQVRFLAKKELAANKLIRGVFDEAGVILVDRHNSDMEAMRACLGCLRQGHVLGIFPEGTRHHEGVMEELETGVALMALRARVPVYPVMVPKLRFLRRVDCVVGEEIPTDDLREQGINKETCNALLERIKVAYKGFEAAENPK